MDDPFGALDFLTQLKMRSDPVRIWQSERKQFFLSPTTSKKPSSLPIACW
jgi:ABC-type taurine transport system ATPase subunit